MIPSLERPPAWAVVTDMERPLRDLISYAHGVGMIGQGINDDDGAAVSTLAFAIKDIAERIEEERGKLFHMLHPNSEHRKSA